MASNIVLNGTTYSGSPASPANPFKPSKISTEDIKIGVLHTADDGSLTWVHKGIKKKFTIDWPLANETTRAALRTLHELTTSFTFVDHLGVSRTVITVEADLKEDTAFSDLANNYYYDLSITLRQV